LNSTSANFTVYNSSAGSGKTFTLVKEYLKIALRNNNSNAYKGILAVTFTNKAASEMKERVISALQALSGQKEMVGTPKHLLDALLKPINQGGLGITELEIKQRSGLVLRSILHNYNDFAISTIDKFTTKIIRTFALDLKLPLNFGIELNEDEVLKNSVDMLIAEIGVNDKLTKLLIDYSKQKADDEKSWNIEIELIKFAKNILKDGGEAHLEKIRNLSIDDFEQIKKDLIVSINSFEKETKEIAKKGLDFIQTTGIEPTSFSSGYYYKYWQGLLELKFPTPSNSLLAIISGEKEWYSKATPSSQKDLMDANVSELTDLFNQSRAFLEKEYGGYILKGLLLKNIYQIAVISEIEKTIQEFKTDNNILNLSDFNKQIAKIILTESIPFIYERLGEKYHHYLIDEFQDTSTIQWQNIIPLIENALGSGNYNMLVGDAKQAIYRFRGGEVEQIINLPYIYNHNNNKLLLEREDTLVRNHQQESLNDNYRSKAEIVDFNNRFFDFVSGNLSDKFSHIYKELNQGFNAENKGGGVSISFLEEDDEITFREIKSIIENALKDGYEYNDIAILTRKNDKASEVASFLLENNIQVISSESLLLNNSSEVKFLLSLFKYIAHPKDATNHLYAINYLINTRFNGEQNIDYFTHKNQNYLADYLKSHNLTLSVSNASTYSLYELTEHFIQHFSLSKEINIFIQFFLDKIHEYATKYDNSIVNFLEWWDSKSSKFSVIIPEGINAVQVMTIHKSKGLEFPIVIFPFVKTSGKKYNEDFIWTEQPIVKGLDAAILNLNKSLLETVLKDEYESETDKSKLDVINLLYVALTRPKDRLYLLNQLDVDKTTDKIPSVLAREGNNYFLDYCLTQPDAKINDSEYQFGLFSSKAVNSQQSTVNNQQTKNEVIKEIVYNPWRSKINISYQAPKFWDVENPENYTDYGNLIHQLLSEIKHIGDLETTLDKFINKGLFDQNNKTEILNELQELLKITKVASFFTDFDELKTETAILLPTGESYQPDRVIIRNNTAIIIDYKTGQKEKKHYEQLENYKIILSQMGYTHIKSYLLYIKSRELIEV
jgi:ATP-dependent exoDNAse (exonuclease V) beta subunit